MCRFSNLLLLQPIFFSRMYRDISLYWVLSMKITECRCHISIFLWIMEHLLEKCEMGVTLWDDANFNEIEDSFIYINLSFRPVIYFSKPQFNNTSERKMENVCLRVIISWKSSSDLTPEKANHVRKRKVGNGHITTLLKRPFLISFVGISSFFLHFMPQIDK